MNPKDYAIRRVFYAVPTLIFISFVVFGLTRVAGSPIAMYTTRFSTQEHIDTIRELYHLNDPVWVQYMYWAQGLLRGDWGWSSTSGSTVTHALMIKGPATLELALIAVTVALILSIGLGTLAGKYQDSWIDHGTRAIAVSGMSMPQFWSALLLVYVFYVTLGWFPLGRSTATIYGSIPHPTGMYTVDAVIAGNMRALRDALWHLVLPVTVLAFANSAVIMRHLRSEMVEKKNEEFVDAARARGVSNDVVYRRHIRRNALIPTLTVAGLSLAFLVRGAVLVELVFGWPGLGRWAAQAALGGDFAAIMGFILVTAIAVLGVNLLVDILYAYLDPRIELGE